MGHVTHVFSSDRLGFGAIWKGSNTIALIKLGASRRAVHVVNESRGADPRVTTP
jgi:hypothetical protein